MKRAGRVWIRIFPDVPVSKKPAEVRMGSGKGAPEFWVAKVKPGRILFEIDGVDRNRQGSHAPGRREAFDHDQVRRAQRLKENDDGEESSEAQGASEEGHRRQGASKADDFRAKTADELGDAAGEAEEGAVQPALPARQRPAREYRPHARRAPGHRPHPDRSDRTAPQVGQG